MTLNDTMTIAFASKCASQVAHALEAHADSLRAGPDAAPELAAELDKIALLVIDVRAAQLRPRPYHTGDRHRTGRTTILAEAAREAIRAGARVLVVGANHRDATRIAGLVGAKCDVSGIDMLAMNLRGSGAVPMVDHWALEQLLAKLGAARADAAEAKSDAKSARIRLDFLSRQLDTTRELLDDTARELAKLRGREAEAGGALLELGARLAGWDRCRLRDTRPRV
jgi:hypothetical protein